MRKQLLKFLREDNRATVRAAQIAAVALIIAGLLRIGGELISKVIFHPSEIPILTAENPVIEPYSEMVFIAENATAQCKDTLGVEYDGIVLNQAALPSFDPDVFQWTFNIRKYTLSQEMKALGPHHIRLIFPNHIYSEEIKISFVDKLKEKDIYDSSSIGP